jgi:aspartate racemase
MKVTGIVGGLGWESSAVYYRVMNEVARERLGGLHSARVLLDSLDFHTLASANSRDDFSRVRNDLVDSALRLERAGAAQVLIACNTAHRFAPSVEEALRVPLLHIADACGQALKEDGHQIVGLLGTRATTEGSFYRKHLEERYGLQVVVTSRNERDALHEMIVSELREAEAAERCAPRVDEMIASLVAGGASCVLLGCTELGSVFGNEAGRRFERQVPLYDSAILHAHFAVNAALSE